MILIYFLGNALEFILITEERIPWAGGGRGGALSDLKNYIFWRLTEVYNFRIYVNQKLVVIHEIPYTQKNCTYTVKYFEKEKEKIKIGTWQIKLIQVMKTWDTRDTETPKSVATTNRGMPSRNINTVIKNSSKHDSSLFGPGFLLLPSYLFCCALFSPVQYFRGPVFSSIKRLNMP